MSAQHTPGPWKYENGHGVIACGNPLRVAGRTKIAQANRALIAAAPDLLAALHRVRDSYVRQFNAPAGWEAKITPNSDMAVVLAAIAKATTP